jgi:hypothetical protein
MLTSLASGAAGALEDDPLTSPSFSRPAVDSRSYRRNNAQTGADGSAARADDPPAAVGSGGNGYSSNGHSSNGHSRHGYPSGGSVNGDHVNGGSRRRAEVNGAHQGPAYADPGYAYAPDASPAVVTQPVTAAQPGGWHGAPTHTPAHGNPYGSYVEQAPAASYPSAPPMGYQDQQPGAGLPGYSGAHRGYQEPVYDPARTVRYPESAGNGAAGPRGPSGSPGPAGHPAGAGQFTQPGDYREPGYAEDGGYGNGYTGQAPYADSYGAPTTRYVPSYPAEGDPDDQYGPGGYGGYPAGQG